MSQSILLTPAQLGKLKLTNHVVMAPMTRSRASTSNIPGDLMSIYYGQRSSAGLIITEGTSPSPNGLGYARIPGIFNKEQIAGWKKVTDAVHAKGGKIFIQLMHTGRIAHVKNLPLNAEVVAPSAIIAEGQMYTDAIGMQPHSQPKEMSKEDIISTIDELVKASKNAVAAGFDGVELHGANGYLLEQFLSPNANQRTDNYGGNIENRLRFAIEVTQAVATAIGKDKVGIRVSPYGVNGDIKPFSETEETHELLAQKLNEFGILYIHIVDHTSMGAPEVPMSVKQKIRNKFKGTIILSGGYDKTKAEEDLNSGLGNLVAFGRPFISNPDFVERLAKDAILAEPDPKTFYTPGEKGYTDYPRL